MENKVVGRKDTVWQEIAEAVGLDKSKASSIHTTVGYTPKNGILEALKNELKKDSVRINVTNLLFIFFNSTFPLFRFY